MIHHVIGDPVDQGVGVYFLDDRSTDGTAEIVARRSAGASSRLSVCRTSTDLEPTGFQWDRILRRKAELAHQLDADWFIHQDADEFRDRAPAGCSLKGGIQAVDSLGLQRDRVPASQLLADARPLPRRRRRSRSIHPRPIGGSRTIPRPDQRLEEDRTGCRPGHPPGPAHEARFDGTLHLPRAVSPAALSDPRAAAWRAQGVSGTATEVSRRRACPRLARAIRRGGKRRQLRS